MIVLESRVCSFFFSSRRRHTRFDCDWSSDVCSSDLSLGEEQLLVALAAIGIMELLRKGHLDRDVARIEGVVAKVDLGGAAFAELAQHRILPDLRQHRSRHLDSRLRARATAFLTSAGAVPPRWRRAATEPSGVSTRLTSAAILGEKRRRLSSGRAARSRPEVSASRTARATTSWASRNGMPFLTR